MKVEVLRPLRSTLVAFRPGQVVDMPDNVAGGLLLHGFVRRVTEDGPSQEIEEAVAEPPRNAAMRTSRTGGKGAGRRGAKGKNRSRG